MCPSILNLPPKEMKSDFPLFDDVNPVKLNTQTYGI